jgi:putative transposase
MIMTRVKITEDEYYHIYNRGVEKRNIFMDDNDRWRFLTLLFIFQSNMFIPNISRVVTDVRHRMLNTDTMLEVLKNKTVELVSFCLMPNHFHLILKGNEEKSISKFMQRLGNAYTKYFNTKYERKGHLFSGKYNSILIDSNEYLLYLSAYIHLNPRELKQWNKKELLYPWSSFQDFSKENRWGGFLDSSIVSNQFNDSREYKNFVEESDIKSGVKKEYFLD